MKCIFVCIFCQDKYVEMFFLLFESLLKYGNLDNDTNILIYTSTQFMNMIKTHSLYSNKFVFEINDSYSDVSKACKARLDLFNLKSVSNYNKILYLDTDIIVKDSINKVFDVCSKDILYTLEERSIDNNADYWGKSLFGSEIHKYKDKSAFTSAILLFNNCEIIRDLFNKINEDMKNRKHFFHDQPFIVYNAFKYNLYDNKVLKSFAVNEDHNAKSDKVIHHFAGGPGNHHSKNRAMRSFLNNI